VAPFLCRLAEKHRNSNAVRDLILTAIIFKNVIADVTNRIFLTNQAVILTAF